MVLADWPSDVRFADTWAQPMVGLIMIVAAFLAATSRGRLRAVMLVGVTGYGVAMLFLLHGAPDLALTQVLVETVTLVIFALVLRKLPKYFTTRPLHSSRWWRLVIAIAVAVVVCLVTIVAERGADRRPDLGGVLRRGVHLRLRQEHRQRHPGRHPGLGHHG